MYGRQPHSSRGDRLRGVRAVRAPALHAGAGDQARRHGRHPPARVAGRGRPVRGRERRRRERTPPARRRGRGLHRHTTVPPPLAGDGRAGGGQARDCREAAGHDRWPGRRIDRRFPAAGSAADRQPHATVQPPFRRRDPARPGPGAGCGATRGFSELRLGREPAGRALVLGPREKRGDLRRARGPLLRPVCRLARARAGRGGPGRCPAGDRDRGARPLDGPLRRRDPGQLLPRLPPGRADGPAGTPAGVRAGGGDPLGLGADQGPDSGGRGRVADPGPVRPVPRGPARRDRLLRRQGPRLPGAGQGVRRLPDHRDLIRGRPGEVAALRPAAPVRDGGPGRLDPGPQSPAGRDRSQRPRFSRHGLPCRRAGPSGGGRPLTVRRRSTRLLLRPGDVPPSRDDFEVVGVFNPGAVRAGDEVVLLVRVAERPRERRPGFTGLPRWDPVGGLTVDWVPEAELDPIDPRVVRRKADGLVRLTFTSHLRVVRCGDGRAVREITGFTFRPQAEVEEFGVEDPRITPLDGRFYFSYVSVSRHGPATALASTADFRTFDRHGVIFCPENKDVVLFPEKVGGGFAAIHRPVCGTPFPRPEMGVANSPALLHWGAHAPVSVSGGAWQSGGGGAGAPPLRVADGWLEIYHGNRHPARPGEVGTYYGGGAPPPLGGPAPGVPGATPPLFFPPAPLPGEGVGAP